MYTLEKIKQNIAKEINKALAPLDGNTDGVKNLRNGKHLTGLGANTVQASDLISPPNPEFGDLSMPCFSLFKAFGTLRSVPNAPRSPAETASWMVGEMGQSSVVSSVKAAGPYLNFILNKNYLIQNVIKEIEGKKEEYGENKIGKNKKVMIEYSNANTHKEYHVGHLRNICYGDAVNKILSANGYKSIPVSYINDFGIHVAKTLWAYEEFYLREHLNAGCGAPAPRHPSRLKPEESNGAGAPSATVGYQFSAAEKSNKGRFLGQVYVRAARELEKNETAKRLVAMMMKKIESRSGAEYKLWEKTRQWSIAQFDKIYKELGVKFERIFYENEVIDKGMELVGKLYEKGILTKSDGAIIADLNEYDLGVLVFLRSDGTALYPVADLALAEEKFKKYKLDNSIYVVDIRQGQYFKQLFKVLELMGHKQEMKHLGYDFVKLPSGMMSSRTGNVVTYEELREQAIEKAVGETKKRHKDWSIGKIKQAAGAIVNGAIKFEMIKVGANQPITFDIDKALRFEGYTAAYLQYTYARIQSINKKTKNPPYAKTSEDKQKNKKTNINFNNLAKNKEGKLVIKLAKYPDVVLRAGENYDPSEIAKYLFELGQAFNDYYHSVPVLKAEQEIREARLTLINAVARVIENGLGLLGIKVVEEM